MNFFVYRNFTVENLFQGFDAKFSGYGDISFVPNNIDSYLWFYIPEIKVSKRDTINEIDGFRGKIELLISQLPEQKLFIAFTISPLFYLNYQNGDFSIDKAIINYNQFIYDLGETRRNFKVIDFSEFLDSAETPVFDWKYYYLSQSMISPRFNSKFNMWFQLKLNSIENKRKKCLVLDLDNTLWGGILGEDGLENLKIGDSYPGLAYLNFQEAILEASKAGIILAICSKNNEEDVIEVFEKHPFQIIKLNHISARRINWNDKASNIYEISQELNIGLDSIVFIDDNPIERERVRQMIPEVVVPDFPSSPIYLLQFFREVYENNFQAYKLTEEDVNKTKQYLSNAERSQFKRSFNSVHDYLESLEMQLDIYEASNFTIPRIAQMTQKTNQFNLTTRRYTEEDIRAMIQSGSLVHCVSVKDKFGDNGISLMSIINIENDIAYFDSFLLSCRILGRNIEIGYINYILNYLLRNGIKLIKAIYLPSKKNIQTIDFYESIGFRLENVDDDGSKHYSLEIKEEFKVESYFKINLIKNE
jgi:FkbH-like protein